MSDPFDMKTSTDGPLAIDVRDSVVASLRGKGVQVTAVELRPDLAPSAATQALVQAGRERAILITLNEWKSATFVNTALIYDVTLRVLDRSGRTLAENMIKGRDDLGGSGISPPAHAKEAVPAAFRIKFEQLLSDPRIVAALR